MRPNLKQIGQALWLPVSAGALTFAVTWLEWFLIEPACVPTATAPCPLLPWGRYITQEILGQCLLHTVLVMTVTGGSDAMLFIQERKRSEEQQKINEQQLADARAYNEQQLADAREYWEKRLAEDRERADRAAEKQEALTEWTFQLLVEARLQHEARIDEMFRIAAEERAAAAERRQHEARMDDRIRRLEAQLAAQQQPPAN